LAESFYHNSTYAFSENRVINGIELEGLEYVNSEDARVEVKYGTAFIKLENFSDAYQRAFREKNPSYGLSYNNPDGTVRGAGSLDVVVRTLDNRYSSNPQARLSNNASDPAFNPNRLELGSMKNSRHRSTRLNGPYIQTSSGASRGQGGAALILNAINFGLSTIRDIQIGNDNRELVKQTIDGHMYWDSAWNSKKSPFTMAIEDVTSAIKGGLILEEMHGIEQISAIINIVFSGGTGNEDEDVRNVAQRILDQISNPRINEAREDND